jgi:hypothetical protein
MIVNGKINDLVLKVENLKKNIGENKDVTSSLNEIVNILSQVVGEMSLIKNEVAEVSLNHDELTQRLNDIEEFLDESECCEDDGVIARLECPYCNTEVVIGEEFLTDEEPKVICQNCKNEIEVITSPCGCGCEDEEDGDCECGCDCGDSEEEDCHGGCCCGDSKN